MKTSRLFKIGVPVLVLLALLVITTTVLANTPGTDNLCGKSGPWTGPNGLIVKKGVYCEKTSLWTWDIFKSADQSSLTLAPGETFTVNYTVTANATATDSQFKVSGEIGIWNPTSSPVTLASVSDSLGAVDCGVSFPYTLPAGYTLNCSYAGTPNTEPSENVATVVDVSGVVINAVAPIDWSKAIGSETDECIDVNDSFAGFLGTVCAGEQTSFSFTYSRLVVFDECGKYTVDNTASFLTNDTGITGESSVSIPVDVPCVGGCSLTPGYWKTHSQYGPAPYDTTWAMIGEDTAFFFSGQTYYQVLWTSPQGNAYYILAHAYIAAQLNQLNGADFSAAQTAFNQATALFNNPANTPVAVGALKGAARNTWLNLATILDNYNNGLIGPGHCSE